MEIPPENWETVKALFEAAVELTPVELSAFLQNSCQDPNLRAEVERLLREHRSAGSFLSKPAIDSFCASQDRGRRFQPGELIAGRLKIVRFIGAGGMGEVYHAHDEQLDRDVALKVLPAGTLADEASRKQFRKEALALARLNHPNIETVHEFSSQDGVDFLVMELIGGHSLSQKLQDGPLEEREIIRLGIQFAEGLAAAHARGVVHRDLKPGNLMVTPEGRLKILDFGLARITQAAADPDMTQSVTQERAAVAGTVPYMAPEQLRGERVDARTDLHAAGAVLYEMATGKRAFSDTQQTRLVDSILHEPPPSPRVLNPRISSGLEAIIQRAMEKEPARRYQTAREVLGVLEGLSVGVAPTTASWRKRRPLTAAKVGILLIFVVFAAVSIWLWHRGSVVYQKAKPIQARRSVAVIGFKNLTGRPEAEWLSTALSQMLSTELAAGEILRTVPGETVARTKNDLSLADTDTLAPETLARLGKILGADLVVIGSYVALSEGKIRLDLRLQDVASGETVLADAETGVEDNLFDLVSRAGGKLREKCGVASVSPDEGENVKASLPSDPEAARLYAEGLAKLRVFDALAARDVLQKAVALEPNHALAHSALAQAWSALGYDEKARQAAEEAFGLSKDLSREDRLLVEALYRETSKEWERAADACRTLFGFFPDNLEYGILLSNAQTRAGNSKEALVTVESLRKLPPPAGKDPRIDLAGAEASYFLGDFKLAQSLAARAAQNAKATGAKLLLARALYRESSAFQNLDQAQNAIATSNEAKAIYAAAGDRNGVASTLEVMAGVSADHGDLPSAISSYERELAIAREVGNKRAESSALNNLAIVLDQQGDLAGAKKMYEQALATFQEIGDQNNWAMTLLNIGGVLKDQGDLEGASKTYQQTLSKTRELDDRSGTALALSALGTVLDAQGDFPQARKMLDESLAIDREDGRTTPSGDKLVDLGDLLQHQGDLAGAAKNYHDALELSRGSGDKSMAAYALFGLGNLAIAGADFAGAKKYFDEALALRNELGERGNVDVTRVALARLAVEQNEAQEAAASLREVREDLRTANWHEDEIEATCLLARALLAQGDVADAQRELEGVAVISAKNQNLAGRLDFAIVSGLVESASGKPAAARTTLNAVLAEAAKSGFLNYELEARLALAEIDLKRAHAAKPGAQMEKLEREAKAKGFELVAREAAAMNF